MGWWLVAGGVVALAAFAVGWVVGSILILLKDDSLDWDDEDLYL